MPSNQIGSASIGIKLELNQASVKALRTKVKSLTAGISKTAKISVSVELAKTGQSRLNVGVKALATKVSRDNPIKLRAAYDRSGNAPTAAAAKIAATRMRQEVKFKASFDKESVRKGTSEAQSFRRKITREIGGFNSRDIPNFDLGVSGLSKLGKSAIRAPITAFRSLLSAALALSPALISVASSASFASAGLFAIAPAAIGAAAGIGALIGSFYGVAEAMKMASTLDDQMTTSTSKNAGVQLRNSEALSNAAEAIRNAERNVATAQRSAAYAQRDINRERSAAKRDLEDLRELVSDLAKDEEGASIALARALERQKEVNADVKSTYLDRREAAYDVKKAEEELDDISRQHLRGTIDLNKEEKKGVEGSDRVVEAKQRAKDAADDLREAQRDLKRTQVDLTRTFLEQAEAAKTVDPAAARLTKILNEMSPAGRKMFYVLRSMKEESKAWRRQIESKTLPGFISFLTSIRRKGSDGASTMDVLVRKTGDLGASLGRTAKSTGRFLASGLFKKSFKKIMNDNVKATDSFGKAFNNLLAPIFRLSAAASPLLVRFGGYLEKITKRFAKWIDSFSDAELKNFFKSAGDELAKWWNLAVNVGRILSGILKAAFPSGTNLVSTLEKLTDRLADFVNSKEGQQKVQAFFDKFTSFIKGVDYKKFKDIIGGLGAISLMMKAAALMAASNPLILLFSALAISYPEETARIMKSISDSLGGVIRWAANNPKAVSSLLALLAAYKTLSMLRGFKFPSFAGAGSAGAISQAAGGTMLQAAKIQAAAGAEMLTAARLMAGGGLASAGGSAAGAAAGAGWKKGFLKGLGGIAKQVGLMLVITVGWELVKKLPGNEGMGLDDLLKVALVGESGRGKSWTELFKDAFHIEGWKNAWKSFTDWWNNDWRNFWIGFGKIFVSGWRSFSGWFNTSWRDFWIGVGRTIADWWKGFAKWWVDRWTGLWSGTLTTFNGWKSALIGAIRGLGSSMVTIFGDAVSAIGYKFGTLKQLTAAPVNFIINTVYGKGIKTLLSGVAMAVGMTLKLPNVQPLKFATGGIAPGTGNRDTVPAMLTPGEGILTKAEMKKLGGPQGFEQLRKRIQYFSNGGVVKDVPYANLFNSVGGKYGLQPALLAAIAKQESGFNPRAVSSAGAQGLMQFMPGTAKSMGVNPWSPASAIDGAARYMRSLLKKFGGNLGLALTGYNVGPYGVDGINGYARSVMSLMGQFGGSKGVFGKISSVIDTLKGGVSALARKLASKTVEPLIDKIPGKGLYHDLLVTSSKKMLAGALSFADKHDTAPETSGVGTWSDVVNGGGGQMTMGYRAMMSWIKRMMGGKVSFNSTFRKGDRGYHGSGRAIDLGFPDRSEYKGGGLALKAFNLIKGTFMKNIKELIWDFAGSKAVWNGKNHFYTGPDAGPGTHNDHIHWAMDNGGVLPPKSTTLVTNATRQREYALTEDKLQRINGGNSDIDVKVYIGDRELTDIVDVQINRNSSNTISALRRGRRKGA